MNTPFESEQGDIEFIETISYYSTYRADTKKINVIFLEPKGL
ncbi:hypothetical protein Bandiella_01252 [Candidatus Bandiella woodruffii]|uniref:Uncharacterized protein n=1 Tax=Candidatus Bandiella euplotis TaxID=1664265 RepID=A0ABZ0UQW6_9RICK|nr:hypothetical protein Bandiella_01252 [Candidatus Bandiella woodruffii]